MTRHGLALLALSIIAIAGWAYNVNYNTLTAMDRVSELRREIAKERETLQVLRVEWAYLNAPDRLMRLVRQHNDRLALIPVMPEALKHVAAVPFPGRQAEPEEPVPIIDHTGVVPVP
ncbi:MAG: hypothetical protein AAF334_11510, partial [Pseudomonadota bacterium]